MEAVGHQVEEALRQALRKREENGSIRSLMLTSNLVDFCSNDYLGFARSENLRDKTKAAIHACSSLSGSTGSRSISGNTAYAEDLEKHLANFHHTESALLFNSGYDANVGLFSSLASRGDTLITDELIHASIIDGCRLSHAERLKFAHNDLDDLEKKLSRAKGHIFVAVESVYSMDGDMAPLEQIASLCEQFGAALIVDEAHATGVFGHQGRGLVNQLNLEDRVFARVHTFGKAIGGHGAVVVGSETLRKYLINFARSFIFTTALPVSALTHVRSAYETLTDPSFDQSQIHGLIKHFKQDFRATSGAYLIDSVSPVQCVVVGGNQRTKSVAQQLRGRGFDVRAILNPSVPQGKERLRISLHLHNTFEEIESLNVALSETLSA